MIGYRVVTKVLASRRRYHCQCQLRRACERSSVGPYYDWISGSYESFGIALTVSPSVSGERANGAVLVTS